jgi:hypothetical protein
MKRLIGILFVVLLASPLSAVRLKQDSTATMQRVETRVEAEFTKKFRYGLSLSLSEEIRARVFETNRNAYFRAANTTIALGYTPIKYLKLQTGYTLRILGDKDWADPNEFLRHRVYLGVTAKYSYMNWRFSLRERVDMNCRTDSVNRYEKNPIAFTMRHRIHIGYHIPGKPVQVYANIELINTLNRPTQYLNYYIKDEQFGQYLSDARLQVGTKWRIDKRNWLGLSYRFGYFYDRDLNITKNGGNIELTRTHGFTHVITLSYDLKW